MAGRLIGIARRKARREPMLELPEAEVTLEGGVAGDPRGKPGDRQVTVVSREAWEAACAELGRRVPWTLRRANLLVEGVELAHTTGRVLRIGPVRLEVCGETDPCHVMDAQAPGLRGALRPDWRGGVSCRVRVGGTLRPGDEAALEPS